MIVKLRKAKQIEKIDEAGIIIGMLLMTVISYIANKFYNPAKNEMTAAGKAIDTASDKLIKAVEADAATMPEATNLAQRIAREKQKFISRIQKIKEQAMDVDKVSDMPEKPSVMISKEITEYQNVLEMLKLSVKGLKPSSRRAFDEAKREIERANSTIKNIDLLVLMIDKKRDDGLWKSVITKTDLEEDLSKDKNWKGFVKLLMSYVK